MTPDQKISKDGAPLLESLFELAIEEGAYAIDGTLGELPRWLRGSYYLNGPALFSRAGQRYRHWLDGDGLVTALHFRERGVEVVHRFVRSTKFVDESRAERLLYRAFGTAFEGDRLKRGIGLESPVNVSVYRWRDVLLAFGEQGLPWELDPVTLETRGEYNFDGKLNAISPLSAHPCFDPTTGEMINFGISFSARQPSLTLYRFSRDGELLLRRRLPIDFPCSVHDFGLSKGHAIFYLSPYLLDVEKLMRAGSTLIDALLWQPERGSQLVIAARESGEKQATLPLEGKHCLHLIGCFEDDGRLIVDFLELERPIYDQYQVIPDLFTTIDPGRPVRLVVDVAAGKVVARRELGYEWAPDFPAIDPRRWGRRYDDFWLLGISATGQPGRKFYDELVHLSWAGEGGYETYRVPKGQYLGGEPIFLGDPASSEHGVVICQLIDAESQKGWFLLFDAFEVAKGPIAKLPLRRAIPPCFHASFAAV